MRVLIALGIALVLLGCASRATSPSPDPSSDPIPSGRTLLPVAEGAWQVYELPAAWRRAHLGSPPPARAYFSLVAAHPEDIADDLGTCPPPQRLVLGVVGRDGTLRERTFACLKVCDVTGDDAPYRGLWASATHLQGVTAQLRDDGTIDVIEHYREQAFMPPEVAEDPTLVAKMRFEGGPRLRHRAIAPSEFQFSEGGARSCVALEEGL